MTLFGRALLCFLAVTHIGITHGKEATAVTVPGTDQCGKRGDRITPAVAEDSNVYLGMYPWMAALGFNTSRGDIHSNISLLSPNTSAPKKYEVAWLCNGFLVTERHVITTAKCLGYLSVSNLKLEVVRLGDLNLTDSIGDGASPSDYEVDSWLLHPKFQYPINNIAIVRLKISVTFTRFVQPICLPTIEELKTAALFGYYAYLAGWGYNYYGQIHVASLRESRLGIIVCDSATMYLSESKFNGTAICAGSRHLEEVTIDGLLMVRHGPGENFYLYGVEWKSMLTGCTCYTGRAYVPAAYFLTWILSNLV